MIEKEFDEKGNVRYIISGKDAEVISIILQMSDIQQKNIMDMIKVLGKAWIDD